MKILVTGAAGFIGMHTSLALLKRGDEVFGLDNLCDYYDVQLKLDRLEILKKYPHFHFEKMDLADKESLRPLFEKHRFDAVINLAAQAGVRYSIDHPEVYIKSNIEGFLNILEGCRHTQVKHLVYASSSSVYGGQKKMPFSVEDSVDHPISTYAATKKSNELMAHAYSHLFHLPTTGLRFFTVYGPWGRPDMSLFLFTKAILEGKPIKVFNQGNMVRDFTYIDDIVEGVVRVLDKKPEGPTPYALYNIGNNNPVNLMDFIAALETTLGKKAQREFLPMQPGDVHATCADVDALMKAVGFRPKTTVEVGIRHFVAWYTSYFAPQA